MRPQLKNLLFLLILTNFPSLVFLFSYHEAKFTNYIAVCTCSSIAA
ncbi:hypothetical protein HMPREF9124_0507 [Oribacterium sp. oral taxon 108 str. F0425]|nr:hypothetical protein HMPREF9124_0507 [Oribacterium sp. oral taxon 108 str. F0425]